MVNDDLTNETSIKLSIGHLVALWDILSNRLVGTQFFEGLSDEEKRAIWALEDLCERGLVESGIAPLPEPEWVCLVSAAKEHVKSIPVEFLD